MNETKKIDIFFWQIVNEKYKQVEKFIVIELTDNFFDVDPIPICKHVYQIMAKFTLNFVQQRDKLFFFKKNVIAYLQISKSACQCQLFL